MNKYNIKRWLQTEKEKRMKKYLMITIDTEEDNWGEIQNTKPSTDNIKNIPNLQNIFRKHSAIPTYLINYPVANDYNSANLIKKYYIKGECDIGAHCHPWNTPPFYETFNNRNSFMCNLPEDLLQPKLSGSST